MGTKRNVDMADTSVKVKKIKTKAADESKTTSATKSKPKTKATTTQPTRGQKYRIARSLVDKTKTYDPFAAVELVKKLSYSRFPGTITAHAVVKKTGTRINVEFPYSTGKTLKVVIFDAQVLKKIEAGEIEFDVLLAKPQDMAKLTKHAPVLGPQGLMPNPKDGTLTPNPELKQKQLSSGKLELKTERKAPLMHVVIGKTNQDTKELVENLQILIKALKGKLVKLALAPTMGPSVKVKVE
ncbi:MAG: hypothetical protein GF390_04110 [Candidatus Pacebacteria bacterium]|nr:hypothetical protein [Candidatus Paceibacterota bacterium]